MSNRKSLAQLRADLEKADAAFSDALDARRDIDLRRFAARQAGTRGPTKVEERAVENAERRGCDNVDRALVALCRYRPRTGEELAEYVSTALLHQRIKDAHANTFTEFEAEPARLILKNINAAAVDLLLRRES
jgi:hypothetical protein